MSLVFITLILLTGYCILDKKAPKQVEGYLPGHFHHSQRGN